MTIEFTTQMEVTRDGTELLVEISGLIDPYRPGKITGPPENCWPPEGGYAELSDAMYLGQPFHLTADEQVQAEQQLYEQWEVCE